MALINIEYGSLASSETMNSNFQYLDDKISEVSSSFTISISSVSSNIATVNANLTDLAETLDSTKEELKESIENADSRIVTTLMLPDWSGCISISKPNSYKAPSNGYVLINPQAQGSGNLIVNGVTVYLKYRGHENDNSAQLVPYPVKKGDIMTCNVKITAVYFLPVVEEIIINNEEENSNV